jgi:hypothetical protein
MDAGESSAAFAVAIRLLGGIAPGFFFMSVRQRGGGMITHALSADAKNPKPFALSLSRFWPVLYIALFLLQIAV